MHDLPFSLDVTIVSLLASPVHRFEGRPLDGPLESSARELHNSIDVRAGLGIVGDRYFGRSAHVTSAVTVQAIESLEYVAQTLGLGRELNPADTRRNIIVRGVPIDAMRDVTFSLDSGPGPVVFRAHRPANPCAWMDVTLAPGAHRALRARGGMRCEPLTDGTLTVGPAVLLSSIELASPALF